MDSGEGAEEAVRNSGPGSPVETRPKAIGAWRATAVHPVDGGLDLLQLELGRKRRPINPRRTAVEGVEVEGPARLPRPAQEAGVEGTEGFSFASMGDDDLAVDVEGADVVPAKSLR